MEKRIDQWIQASHGLSKVEEFMVPNLQGLGRLDCQLISQDEEFLQLSEEKRSTIQESLLLTDRFTMSYLWVLGAYELVRSLDQRCQTNKSLLNSSLNNSIRDLKHQFERLRIPLAKMEPSNKHPTDSPIAFPAISRESGVAWQLDATVFVTRRELSDALLQLIVDIKKYIFVPN